eukprot:1584440-Prymnesium_polylepis.1
MLGNPAESTWRLSFFGAHWHAAAHRTLAWRQKALMEAPVRSRGVRRRSWRPRIPTMNYAEVVARSDDA